MTEQQIDTPAQDETARSSAESAQVNCDCGFSAEVCKANSCLRKKVHLAGLTPGSKWPYTGIPSGTSEAPLGTSECPICGLNEPHSHTPKEIEIERHCLSSFERWLQPYIDDPIKSSGISWGYWSDQAWRAYQNAWFFSDWRLRKTAKLMADVMNATTVSCAGLKITIACDDHSTKDAIINLLTDGLCPVPSAIAATQTACEFEGVSAGDIQPGDATARRMSDNNGSLALGRSTQREDGASPGPSVTSAGNKMECDK